VLDQPSFAASRRAVVGGARTVPARPLAAPRAGEDRSLRSQVSRPTARRLSPLRCWTQNVHRGAVRMVRGRDNAGRAGPYLARQRPRRSADRRPILNDVTAERSRARDDVAASVLICLKPSELQRVTQRVARPYGRYLINRWVPVARVVQQAEAASIVAASTCLASMTRSRTSAKTTGHTVPHDPGHHLPAHKTQVCVLAPVRGSDPSGGSRRIVVTPVRADDPSGASRRIVVTPVRTDNPARATRRIVVTPVRTTVQARALDTRRAARPHGLARCHTRNLRPQRYGGGELCERPSR
jgi:hypothetical protein